MHTEVVQPQVSGDPESQTGWRRLHERLFREPVPGGARWATAFRSLLSVAFLAQAISGVLLAMNYAPSTGSAWASVRFIQEEVQAGWLIRAMHYWGSSAMVVLVLTHVVRMFITATYKKPRELAWVVSILCLGCTLALALTGDILPWDQQGYWATKIRLGIVSTIPSVGESIRTLVQGGPQIGNLTLTRFFTLHVVILPALLVGLACAYNYFYKVPEGFPSERQSPDRLATRPEPFWPGHVWKGAVLAAVLLFGLAIWSGYHRAPLQAKADPALSYEARPEWFFMFLYQLLKYFQGPYEIIGTFFLPSIFGVLLVSWPFLDRGRQRDARRRPLAMGLLSAVVGGLAGLTIVGYATDTRKHGPTLAPAKLVAPSTPRSIEKPEVARIFKSECASCHDDDGTGNVIRKATPAVPDFTSLAWQMAQTDLDIVQQIQVGKEPAMPAYKERLTKEQTLALAIYIRALSVGPVGAGPTLAATSPLGERDVRNPVASAPVSAATGPRPESTDRAAGAPPGATALAPQVKSNEQAGKSPATAPSDPKPAAALAHVAASGRPELTANAGSFVRGAAFMESDRLYRTYCKACHDVDGSGKLARRSMPEIPDMTDPRWSGSRTDADLFHSILLGKGKFMRPMNDKLSAPDADRLVAFVRALAMQPGPLASRPVGPAPYSLPRDVFAVAATPPAVGSAAAAPTVGVPSQPATGSPLLALADVPQSSRRPVPIVGAQPPAVSGTAERALVAAATAAASGTADTRIRTAIVQYREFCMNCHGVDGRGTESKAAMPTIPDFTDVAWQNSKNRFELASSIIEGKGKDMPAFEGRISAGEAQDLVAYIRSFGPRQARPSSPVLSGSEFQKRVRRLEQQHAELERQLRELSAGPRRP
jgi:ubiquinol-cytochrome c reductase cytochrome b subunit